MQSTLPEKILSRTKWFRGLLILLFFVVKYLIAWIINFISIFQFIINLITDKPNPKLLEFSKCLNVYLLQIVNYLTYNSDTKPFPFTDWP